MTDIHITNCVVVIFGVDHGGLNTIFRHVMIPLLFYFISENERFLLIISISILSFYIASVRIPAEIKICF